jgi:hypothetical protein
VPIHSEPAPFKSEGTRQKINQKKIAKALGIVPEQLAI